MYHENCTGDLTPNSPKYLEWNSVYEKLKGFFPLKYAILSFGKCLNNQILGFQRGYVLRIVTVLNWKDPLKYFFLLPNCIAGR